MGQQRRALGQCPLQDMLEGGAGAPALPTELHTPAQPAAPFCLPSFQLRTAYPLADGHGGKHVIICQSDIGGQSAPDRATIGGHQPGGKAASGEREVGQGRGQAFRLRPARHMVDVRMGIRC